MWGMSAPGSERPRPGSEAIPSLAGGGDSSDPASIPGRKILRTEDEAHRTREGSGDGRRRAQCARLAHAGLPASYTEPNTERSERKGQDVEQVAHRPAMAVSAADVELEVEQVLAEADVLVRMGEDARDED